MEVIVKLHHNTLIKSARIKVNAAEQTDTPRHNFKKKANNQSHPWKVVEASDPANVQISM